MGIDTLPTSPERLAPCTHLLIVIRSYDGLAPGECQAQCLATQVGKPQPDCRRKPASMRSRRSGGGMCTAHARDAAITVLLGANNRSKIFARSVQPSSPRHPAGEEIVSQR